jgi:hypothetical protein
MVMDAMRMNYGHANQCLIVNEKTNADTTRLFDLLKDFDEPLWDGCTNHSKLLVVSHVFKIKSDCELSEANYDIIIEWAGSIILEGIMMKENFYAAKFMKKSLGLGYQKIDMCPNFYMLDYLKNVELTDYRTCRQSHYKSITSRGRSLVAHKKLRYFSITHKLQSLFMSPKIIEHMTRHQSHDVIEGVMVHSSVGEVWKHFNSVHSQFLVETRNMHLGLCTNGFNPFWSFAAHYSYWVVILTIYNLLSKICIRPKFMFFSMVLLGPNSPDQNINVCLRPLIDKLI